LIRIDDIFLLADRKQIVSEVTDDLFHLKHSVEKHRPAEEWEVIRSRIAIMRERLEKLAWELE
jgi:hypothetical protein